MVTKKISRGQKKSRGQKNRATMVSMKNIRGQAEDGATMVGMVIGTQHCVNIVLENVLLHGLQEQPFCFLRDSAMPCKTSNNLIFLLHK